ncbi:olfactory receptor 6M1-like [Bombina bombina]|uniref:olfactory receptor 6M1-like n=1 Tax=Bombina bombina TaxID=8345 RepID=UPI00235ACE03|nr:olfactory receptor 6M1-like [Bombina bombina]
MAFTMDIHLPKRSVSQKEPKAQETILDIFFTNTTAPTLLRSFLPGVISISVTNCIVQSYTYFLTGTAEFFLFAVMSFDRYIAICHPLHYNVIMCKKVCIQFICGVLIGSFISVSPPLILFMRLTFCFNLINHFFCDIGPLLMNSCTETQSVQLLSLVNTSVLFFSLIVTVISYISIMVAILRIKSKDGRDKAFSTCSSHAIVVALVFGSCMLMYVRPVDGNILDSNKKLSILNTVIVPLINPYVYTLRNKLVKESLKQALNRTLNRSK